MVEIDNTSGTIDITDTVEKARVTWVKWSTRYIIEGASTVPWLSWLRLPVISQLFEFALGSVLEFLSKSAVMAAFFLNTTLRKASQARDFVSAVQAREALPKTATQKEYQDAEKLEMLAFSNFVRVSN